MRRYNNYSNDPRWIKAKFNSACNTCQKSIKKGEELLYYPIGKKVFCDTCGEKEYNFFISSAQDEFEYNSQY